MQVTRFATLTKFIVMSLRLLTANDRAIEWREEK